MTKENKKEPAIGKKGTKELSRFGNFVILERVIGINDWIIITNASRNWEVRFRDDNEMFTLFASAPKEIDEWSWLGALVLQMYYADCIMHDVLSASKETEDSKKMPYLDGFFKLIHEEVERNRKYVDTPTEEQDKEAGEEAFNMETLKEELMQEPKKD